MVLLDKCPVVKFSKFVRRHCLSIDGFCYIDNSRQWRGAWTYLKTSSVNQIWAAISVRHCPQPTSLLHWTSLLSRPRTGSWPSSPGVHCGPTWQLEMEDWSSKAILAQNCGGRPATYESWTGDCEATCSGPIGLAETRSNGYVVSDTLLKRES